MSVQMQIKEREAHPEFIEGRAQRHSLLMVRQAHHDNKIIVATHDIAY
ncbi:MAG: hypothetical protein JWQ85_1120 [Mucilaginibacter sp.]|jgi:hypothetical protein|nr:hypothetical protein [Mucilaginibacter sp.]